MRITRRLFITIAVLSLLLFAAFSVSAVSATITFSEYPVGTHISTQYAMSHGIIFGGDNPYIENDGAHATTPVLSGTPKYNGAIEGRFVDTADGVTPIGVNGFSLDGGYFNEIGSTQLSWWDVDGNPMGAVDNSIIGIEHFDVSGYNIGGFRIEITSNEPAGFTIDNVVVGDPSGPKVTICHFPPGNPDNAHQISVDGDSLQDHLSHGDILGACPAGNEGPGQSENAPGHDPNGPGNSENAPGHNPNGPGNSGNAPGHDPNGPGNSENARGHNKP